MKDKCTCNSRGSPFVDKKELFHCRSYGSNGSYIFTATNEHFHIKGGVIIHFSVETRNILSKHIFDVLLNNPTISLEDIIKSLIDDIKSNNSWTDEISSDILEELKKKLNLEKYQNPLFNYIFDIVKIIKKFKDLNDNYKDNHVPINILDFSRDLLRDNINLGKSKTEKGFYPILVQIFDYLKNNISDFVPERKIARQYYDNQDKQKRECKRCGKIKSYIEFGTRGTGKLNFYCHSCVRYIKEVLLPKKKIKIISHFFGIENVRCLNPNCESSSNIVFLLTLDFHHKDPAKKNYTWRKLYNTRLEIIYDLLKKEEMTVFCLNCHNLTHSVLFERYKNFIMDKDLFKKTPNEIDKLLDSILFPFKNPAQLKMKIKEWIKKRYIIEQLYDGKCVCCGKINVENNLPSLSFHHKEPKHKEHIWRDLKRLEIEEIIDIIKKEDIICVCSNYHRMIHFKYFKDKISEILSNSCIENIEFYIKKVQEDYLKLFNNMNAFLFKRIQEITDPLKIVSQFLLAWERYLIHIYRITELKNKNEFTPKELAYSLDLYEIHRRENDPFINLVDLGYIEKLGNTHKYIITFTGIEKGREILQNLKLKNINFYNEIIQQVKLIPYLDFKEQHEELRQFLQNKIIAATDQWKRYLIHLFKIIEKKNQNEVKSNELANSLAIQSTSVFSQGAMQTLIKKNLVQEIKSQSSRPNSYILTDNGLIKASELLKEFGIK